MIAAVFDAGVLLQAAASKKGPAGACLAFVDGGAVTLFLSAMTLDEIRDVLHRPEIRKTFPNLTDENVRGFLDHLMDKGHLIEEVPGVYRLDRDPKDEPYLNLAIAAQAPFIISRDQDLLVLMKNDAFRNAYPWLTIVDPPAFLAHVRAQVAKGRGGE